MHKSEDRPILLFDLGNVIVDLDIPATYSGMGTLTQSKQPEFKAFLAESRWLERFETGLLEETTFLEGLVRYANPGVTVADLTEAWNAMLVDIPLPRLDWLKALRKDYKVALLSNTNAIHLRWVHHFLRDRHGINNFESAFFDAVYYSHEIGHRKPDVSCYQWVLQALNSEPRRVLFIDDVAENTEMARTLGIVACTHPVGAEVMHCLPDYLETWSQHQT